MAVCAALGSAPGGAADKTTFHYDAARTGSNDAETVLTPAVVSSSRFGLIWQSAALDPAPQGPPPRLFATPLYLSNLAIAAVPQRGRRLSVAFVVTTSGYAYAINARRAPALRGSGAIQPGAVLWRRRLTAQPCGGGTMGNLATPVIDRARGRFYVTSCSGEGWAWAVHALDLATGAELPGWPVAVDAAAINRPGTNRNGATRWTDGQIYYQRGALNLNADGSRLYLAFGPDPQGWLVAVDTASRSVVSAFSSTSVQSEEQGGMWGASGASVDPEGRIHIATGASFSYALAKRGIPGVFPESRHSWGQSILQFSDRAGGGGGGLRLEATYTPYNYCQTAASDIDIAGSGAVLFDVKNRSGARQRLLALGGGKQGNAYLLDRDAMPGGTEIRHPCSTDPTTDRSLLAPEVQPALGTRGPINVFGPFSDNIGMTNQAKSRSTLARLHDGQGRDWLYLTGSTKTGADYSVNVPPGLVKVRVVTGETAQPFLRIDRAEMTQTLQNPGSPVVSSNRGRQAIVWVLDPAAARSVDPFGANVPRAVLRAFDAATLRLLWKSADELFPTGKYNEPTVVDGMVLVGTDRLQALGLRPVGGKGARHAATAPTGAAVAVPVAPSAGVGAAVAALSPGRITFQQYCAGCHVAGVGGAPRLDALGRMPRARIVTALTTGKMAGVAGNLSPAEIKALAAELGAAD